MNKEHNFSAEVLKEILNSSMSSSKCSKIINFVEKCWEKLSKSEKSQRHEVQKLIKNAQQFNFFSVVVFEGGILLSERGLLLWKVTKPKTSGETSINWSARSYLGENCNEEFANVSLEIIVFFSI